MLQVSDSLNELDLLVIVVVILLSKGLIRLAECLIGLVRGVASRVRVCLGALLAAWVQQLVTAVVEVALVICDGYLLFLLDFSFLPETVAFDFSGF